MNARGVTILAVVALLLVAAQNPPPARRAEAPERTIPWRAVWARWRPTLSRARSLTAYASELDGGPENTWGKSSSKASRFPLPRKARTGAI